VTTDPCILKKTVPGDSEMANFDVMCETVDGIPVLRVKGYYEKPAGQKIIEHAEALCQTGKTVLVLDFSVCEVLSSPGVATIVELAADLADNYGGSLIICGLDRLKEKVLMLVGMQTMARICASLSDALQAARTAMSR